MAVQATARAGEPTPQELALEEDLTLLCMEPEMDSDEWWDRMFHEHNREWLEIPVEFLAERS